MSMKEYAVLVSRLEETGHYYALLCLVEPFCQEKLYWPLFHLKYTHCLTGIFAHPRYWFRSLESRVTIATRELMAIAPRSTDDSDLADLNKLAAITSQVLRMVSKPWH